jgi:hypothetical protein
MSVLIFYGHFEYMKYSNIPSGALNVLPKY